MYGRIESGEAVTLVPSSGLDLGVGDIVLARVRGRILVLHEILDRAGEGFLIGTAAGREDGWVAAHDIFGRAVFP